jgi:hypothetical protein
MHYRKGLLVAPIVLLLAYPAAATAQDASAVLGAVQKNIGAVLPSTLHVTAAGSGYADAAGGKDAPRAHFRIKSYTADLNFTTPSASEQFVRTDDAAPKDAQGQTETSSANASSPWPAQYMLWVSPYGFLKGALEKSATVAQQTLAGTKYQVVTFSPATGAQVHGFVTSDNVLERTQTEFQDPKRGKVDYEAVYVDWMNFGGLKYPSLIIQKENGKVARILVVQKVEASKS